MSELMSEHWQCRDGGGMQVYVEGLGLIEVYQSNTPQGRVVFINGKQAYGGCRYDINGIVMDISDRVRQWQYLNTFREPDHD